MNDFLEEFFSHSKDHPNGWGLALFDRTPVFVEKEPRRARDSGRLKEILEEEIETSTCLAHIRWATIGEQNLDNTHPFRKCDDAGRVWTVVHNGTIFDSELLSPYQYVQVGTTDSERILLYIVDEMNRHYKKNKGRCRASERIRIIDDMVRRITPGNKVDIMIYDGEYLYIHKNEPGTMYIREEAEGAVIATKALEKEGWREVDQNRLLVYREGELVYEGQQHENTYIFDEEKMKLLFLQYSGL